MPQLLFKATGLTANNNDKVKDTGMAVDAVKWVNINGDNIVVTFGEGFDESAFILAIQGADSSVSLSK